MSIKGVGPGGSQPPLQNVGDAKASEAPPKSTHDAHTADPHVDDQFQRAEPSVMEKLLGKGGAGPDEPLHSAHGETGESTATGVHPDEEKSVRFAPGEEKGIRFAPGEDRDVKVHSGEDRDVKIHSGEDRDVKIHSGEDTATGVHLQEEKNVRFAPGEEKGIRFAPGEDRDIKVRPEIDDVEKPGGG
jgi:hypothetical protein